MKNSKLSRPILAIIAITVLATTASAQFDAGTLKKEDVAHNAPDYLPFVDRHIPDIGCL